jgi:predicted small lipoprotein YifL
MLVLFRTFLVPAILMAVAGLMLSGCGRKGDFDRPHPAATTTGIKPATPGKTEVEDRPFFLDKIL